MQLPNPRYFLPAAFAAILLAALLASIAFSDENWTDTQIVNAIYKAEGGVKAQYAYGIRSIRYNSITEAKRICFNTVRNNRKRYTQYGHKDFPDFLSFLASRYCPTTGKLSKAEKKLNGNWLKNVKYFLMKGG